MKNEISIMKFSVYDKNENKNCMNLVIIRKIQRIKIYWDFGNTKTKLLRQKRMKSLFNSWIERVEQEQKS